MKIQRTQLVSPEKQSDSKGTNEETIMQYTTGDRLKLTGISGNYSTVITDVPSESKTITFYFIPCTDGDGNNYPVVQIGEQTWMAENLKTTKYLNGDLIGTTTPASANISGETTPKYQWAYNGNEANVTTYGRLYTWYAITDNRNVCPTGWHLPNDAEWTALTTSLGEDVAGGKLKETGLDHWDSPNTGATNETGFTALPGGIKDLDGTFYGLGDEIGYWWSSSESAASFAWGRSIYYNLSLIDRYEYNESYGFSVRCVKDQPKTPEAFPGIDGELMDFIIDGDTITVEKINDKYVFQGDILLTEDQLTSGSKKGAGFILFMNKWNCNTVYYKINDNLQDKKNEINAAIEHFKENTSLNFIEWTDPDQKNYVEFVWNGDGNASDYGMVGNRQEIWISHDANTGTVIHEIGHAIGLIHEHSRYDAYKYVKIIWNNIDYTLFSDDEVKAHKEAKANFDMILTLYQTSYFDFNSVMLYHSYTFSKGYPNYPTIRKLDGSTFGVEKVLSVGDIEVIKMIYTDETVKDIDGNCYRVVTIGTQVWMAENLKTSKYNDGTVYSNTPANSTTCGRLYNWYAVNTGKLCPTGWHVPTDREWTTLTTFLGGAEEAGGKLKATSGWDSPNTGATDEFYFTALPCGLRVDDGTVEGIGYDGLWWSSTEVDTDFAWGRTMENDCTGVYEDDIYKQFGLSVRCIRDQPAPSPKGNDESVPIKADYVTVPVMINR